MVAAAAAVAVGVVGVGVVVSVVVVVAEQDLPHVATTSTDENSSAACVPQVPVLVAGVVAVQH